MDLARKRAMNLPSAVIRSLKAHTASGALATSDVARSSLVDLEGSGSQMSSFLANQKSESIRKAVYRAKNVAPTDTIDGIDSALTPMIPPPPQIDPFAVWIFAKHFGGPVEEHYYAWTTNRMLESVHWWMQTNGKVRDGVGEVYLSFDGDHDVISAQGRSRGFTSFMKFEQEDTTLEERSASGQKRVASSQFENRRHQQRASRKPAWVHIFACVERERVPKNSGYVYSAVPFCGIVAKSENSGVICSVLATALRIVCQDHDQRIDISGVRSDNGAAARLAASKLSSGSLCGCFAHEVFKAERRNKSWTTPFATLEVVWNTDVAGRCCAITQTLSRRSTTHGCTSFYRCPTLAHFRCFGGLLADFAEEVGCPVAAAHLRCEVWAFTYAILRSSWWPPWFRRTSKCCGESACIVPDSCDWQGTPHSWNVLEIIGVECSTVVPIPTSLPERAKGHPDHRHAILACYAADCSGFLLQRWSSDFSTLGLPLGVTYLGQVALRSIFFFYLGQSYLGQSYSGQSYFGQVLLRPALI